MTQKLVNFKNQKLTDHKHDKYISIPEFNKLAAENFAARLAQANLKTKTDFDAKLSSFNRKITLNKTKHLLVENELKKLKSFDLGYFIGKSHFDEHDAQNCLVFQPILKELRNPILYIILVWSLICLNRFIQLCLFYLFLFFWKTKIFRLSVLSVFFVLNQDFNICVIII